MIAEIESNHATVIPRSAHTKTVSLHTLGCKLNRSETDALQAQFLAAGYQVVPFRQAADIAVINTCTVTGEADAKSRQAIRQAAENSGGQKVVAIGCYTQMRPDEAAGIEGVDLILGTRNKHQLFDLLPELEFRADDSPLVMVTPAGESEVFDEAPFISATSRTRAVLKVQDGCDYVCTYCIIPSARGSSRSRDLAACIAEATDLVAAGYKEIVLSGVNVGDWHSAGAVFDNLLDAISRIDGLERIRISSIEPNLITSRTLQLMHERDNIAPHLHMPLQHADPSILAAMRRRYSYEDYRRTVDEARNLIPEIAIGADVITGFPGETEEAFETLATALSELPNAYYHIFRYSEREGTLATAMPGTVNRELRKERSQRLRTIASSRQTSFARSYLTSDRVIHFEHLSDVGAWMGYSDNYIRVAVRSQDNLAGKLLSVHLQHQADGALWGQLAA